MATVLSLLIAGWIWFFDIVPQVTTVHWLTAGVGALFMVLLVMSHLTLIRPIQWAEVKVTPRVSQLVRADSGIRWLIGLVSFLPLLSYTIAVDGIPDYWASTTTVFLTWLVLTGMSLDALKMYFHRVGNYLIPGNVVQFVVQRAQVDIAQGRDVELCEWMATLTETALMSLSRQGSALAERSISGISALLQRFLEVHRRSLQTEAMEAKVHQRTSYVLFYGFERLEQIYQLALQDDLESVCNHIVSSLGKIALSSAYGDISKMGYSLHYIGVMSSLAYSAGMDEVPVKASLTLVEIAKLILNDVDLSKTTIREPMITMVTQLEDIAKAAFRRDKDTNIQILTQPLIELKTALQAHALADRADFKAVISAIDNVLSDFDNLQLILRQMPTIPDLPVEDVGMPEIPELTKAMSQAKEAGKAPQTPTTPS